MLLNESRVSRDSTGGGGSAFWLGAALFPSMVEDTQRWVHSQYGSTHLMLTRSVTCGDRRIVTLPLV